MKIFPWLYSNRNQSILLIIFIFLFTYFSLIRFNQLEKHKKNEFSDVIVDQAITSTIDAEIKSIDLEKREARAELRFVLASSLRFQNRFDTPIEDLKFISYYGSEEFVFKAKQPIKKLILTIPITGINTDYPFDEYEAILGITFQKYRGNEASDPNDTQKDGIPLVFNLTTPITNLKILFEERTLQDYWTDRYTGIPDRTIKISRTKLTKVYSLVIIVMMMVFVIFTIYQFLLFLLYWNRIQNSHLILLSSFLILLPIIRSTQPGIPSYGVLSDIVSFFWAEGIGFTILILLSILKVIQSKVRDSSR